MLELDAGAKQPMYEQIYRYFVGEIHAGRLTRGERLPGKRALCARLGISGSTAEAAYALLVSEGYVTAKPRSGYYVSDFVTFDAPGQRHSAVVPTGEGTPPERPEFDFSTAAVDTGGFPYSTWAKLYKEVVYSSPELLQLGDRQGDGTLRRALCAFLSEYRGVRCTPEQIVVGAGMESLFDVLAQLFRPEVVFGVEDPGYATIHNALRAHGRAVRFLPLDGEGLCADAPEAEGVTVLYLTPSHQFPMGVTMPASRRSRLLRWAAEGAERWIIEDDYDSEFRYGIRPIPAMQGMDRSGRVVYLSTFSRSLAPSVRIAYMVLPAELLARYRALETHRTATVSRYEQAVMARFLSEGYYERCLRRMGNRYRRRRDALIATLEQIEGVRISGGDGGLHFLLTDDRFSEEELRRRAADRGIALRGLSEYCRRCAPMPSTLVVGYGGLDDAGIPAAAQRLRAAWN